ncbi:MULTISPECIES: D-sedoheptulose 7-phosphate isomerase [unclassified Sulfurospirillum]|uniref:D-sedoheptulose 7-phosphate isomerase n=1 Tax=unclassified Sulfurospirillum TaxID=2618290 RepID=UPI0005006A46|nr:MULTISPECIES: D-sedoheptulose 7-phosphate isomerase [unclassified Sulfurospirillum]KFL34014.1 phosphoheptose isomerase [Sulfurospirillum sp. SCADC]
MMEMIYNEIQAHKEVVEKTLANLQSHIYTASIIAIEALKNGNKILLCGNGGSAADAQHIAAELSGRYKIERRGLAGIALTTDTSVLTAVGNDYGFDRIYDRQVEALAKEGDVLIGISTSGHSKNVVRALSLAKHMGCRTIGFSGRDGGVMSEFCDINIIVPSEDTPRIQEMHIMIGHIMCQAIDTHFKTNV